MGGKVMLGAARPVACAVIVTAVLALLVMGGILPASATAGAPPGVAGGAARDAAGRVEGTPVGGPLLGGHGVIVRYPHRNMPGLPDIAAGSFVVADAGTGQVLAAKDPHGWYLPASTLKVLTAVTFIPLLNPNASVVASRRAASVVPNVAGVLPGHGYRVSSLFTALLTISANDAAVVIAEAAGSYAKGIAMMNKEARRLRADDTVAVDPNGLNAPGQHTSAYDLALFARKALGLPAFMRYDETISAPFAVSAHRSETLFNQNRLLTQYPGGIGGKIGWTSAAGATYIGLARRHGVTLIVTLMHCPALTEIASAETLLDWGFAADGKVHPVGTLVSPAGPPLTLTSGAAAAGAAGSQDSGSQDSGSHGAGSHGTGDPRGSAAGRDAGPARHRRPGADPSSDGTPVLAAVAFTGLALLAVGLGFAGTRRQRRGGTPL